MRANVKLIVRMFVVLPLVLVALVAIPTVVLSAASGNSMVAEAHGMADAILRMGGTISPLSMQASSGTVPGTVPTPRPTVRPAVPTPTPKPATIQQAVYANGRKLEKVIGDRLSPTIYGFTEDGRLYRSDNDGRFWTLVTTRPQVEDFVMSAADPDVLYSGEGADCQSATSAMKPMYKSIDGGYSWQELPTGVNLRPLLASQGDPNSIFAADCEVIYLSVDGGQSWTAKPDASAAALWESAVAVDMASASLVGDPAPQPPHWDQLYAAGVNAEQGGVLAFTGDKGNTWANISPMEQTPAGAVAVVADLRTPGRVWLLDEKGVWASDDFGVNWTFVNGGLRDFMRTGVGRLQDLTYGANGQLYLATNRGLYAKSFMAETWAKVNDDDEYDYLQALDIYNMLVTETNPRKMWLNTADGVYTFSVK